MPEPQSRTVSTSFALTVWLAGAWFGFWLSAFAWCNPYLALYGVLSGLGLLATAVVALRERSREESTPWEDVQDGD